jgi:hypothetical protein
MMLASELFAQSRPPVTSPNSFQAVTSHLDAGGDLYLYLNPEDWLKGLSGQINQWRNLANAAPNSSPADRLNVARSFDVLTSVVKNSGIEDVGGFGMTSIAREKGLYRNIYMLYHAKGKDSGYMWSVFGRKPHPLDAIDLLPANTVFASFSDIDLPLVWSILNKEIGQSGIPNAKETLQTLPLQFAAMTGVGFDTVLNSLDGTYGVVLSVDESRPNSPAGFSPQIPDFAVMLVLKVKNESIFNALDTTMMRAPGVIRNDRNGFKMRSVPQQGSQPVSTRTSIAQSGEYFFFSTSDKLIEQALAVRTGATPGLKSRDEFKKLAQGVPDQGNSFLFTSQKATEMISRLMQTRLGASSQAGLGAVQAQLVTAMFGASNTVGAYRVSANTDEGWLSIGNGGQNPANLAMLPFTVVPLMAASTMAANTAVPNLVRSGDAANEAAAVANLRTIAAAETTYAATHGNFGIMPVLIRNGLLDSRFASAIEGYQFAILISGGSYTATATPVSPDTGRYGYFVTTDGLVRYSNVPALAPAGQGGQPVRSGPR